MKPMEIPAIKLKNGIQIPALGLGTYKSTGSKCKNSVHTALEMGYRHIDTAEIYGNQKVIGSAIKGFNREELFLTSKVWYDSMRYKDVFSSLERTLHELGTDYLDLYLIHWPNRNVPMEETFQALGKIYEEGKVRAVGVSNFTINHLRKALEVARIPICVNQVEFHPFLYQKELLDFCSSEGIRVTAYSPIARGEVFHDDVLREVAKTYGKSPAQISLRWLLQQGLIVIPKASSREHLAENLSVFDFELTAEDMRMLNSRPQRRLINPSLAEFD